MSIDTGNWFSVALIMDAAGSIWVVGFHISCPMLFPGIKTSRVYVIVYHL